MNKKQKCLLYAAAAVIVLMGLFPPWENARVGYHLGYNALQVDVSVGSI